ncbi:MAG TPA: MarR family winged helix-turn-helix transcriptional regulator [Pseudothauera hydrothermalis]|jgi:DNA-binding MarR family transcriptional regulator|uniref:MarR family winged helix-turn-helix transcriptional regulator n=1 Tax=Pseudothauera hydrothermalis TaxID=2184083 RepID=UPI000C7C13F3|nr:MarR family winged helix-turn-helix transcriptional regulator [Pseudothauera hydrothermalis]AUM00281.1 MarR family transcriptional regulator [Rhodocyclaceae bacterium]AVZ79459.1 MarR family transcriptional regulator [Zoogloeaceae bacteirum Par-f-2]HNQ75889.1 MarR family winged helix-turn-helix transcriptional regulator [Pseudothauera hydrothermalis]
MASQSPLKKNPNNNSGASPLSVLQRFRVLIRTAQRHSQWIERQSGVTGAQLWAMQELVEAPGLRVGELANRMALHQSTASNMVDRLETGGLIRKERTSADQRVVRLYLTEKGQELLARAPSPARGVLPEALRKLDEASLQRLQNELDGLLMQIKNMDEGFGMQPLPFTE